MKKELLTVLLGTAAWLNLSAAPAEKTEVLPMDGFAVPARWSPAESSVTDKAGLFLQTLFAASYENVRDSFVELLIEDYARDNDSLNMADLIGKTAVYDFASAFGSAYPALTDASSAALDKALAENRSFAEIVEQRRSAFERALKDF